MGAAIEAQGRRQVVGKGRERRRTVPRRHETSRYYNLIHADSDIMDAAAATLEGQGRGSVGPGTSGGNGK